MILIDAWACNRDFTVLIVCIIMTDVTELMPMLIRVDAGLQDQICILSRIRSC